MDDITLSIYNDNLDKGVPGFSEKARYLSLYSGSKWSKKTRISGCIEMSSPRFNMCAFTQPFYAVNYAQNNVSDGFYQRFILSVPEEVYIKIKKKKELIQGKMI